MRIRCLLVLFCLFSTDIFAQESSKESQDTETLVPSDFDNGFVVAFDDKLSTLDGNFANFAGLHGGWLIDHSFLIGMAGYGTTDTQRGFEMGYGGFLVEYFFNPDKLFNYSIRGLIGGGGIENYGNHHQGPDHDLDGFFVAEPEARVTLNVLKPFRIGFGLGYRFVGADSSDLGLSGPTFSFSFKFGIF